MRVIGRRKEAVAIATATQGSGIVRINRVRIENVQPEMRRLMVTEPLAIAEELAKTVDVDVHVQGGGVIGQAEATRQAIAHALLASAGKGAQALRRAFDDYDRALLVSDARRNEPHKPSRSSAGPRRHKQRSKR
ncbi:MAG: 30S ribosomal protein S9 [Candidatus Aenigmatarchaeota archaeon]|nr:MAG: 30S ribosomal protein S9 [Candidatus Aenigmarchaeota archaeon]